MRIALRFRRVLVALFIAAAAPQLAAQAADRPALKSPVRATLFSVLLPGAGQLYAGKTVKGLQILGGTAFAAGSALLIASEPNVCLFGSSCPPKSPTAAVMLGIGAAAVWAYGVGTAAEDANDFNRRALTVSLAPTVRSRSLGVQVGAVVRW